MNGIGKSLLCLAAALLATCVLSACADAQLRDKNPVPPLDPGVVVHLGDQSVTPYKNFLWSSDYMENGWLAADGIGLIFQLPEAAQNLPRLKWDAAYEFEIELPEDATLLRFDLYDGAFDRTHHQIPQADLPAALAEAQGDVCYVVFQVLYQGEYIPSREGYENSGYEYAFALGLDAEIPALEAWELGAEDVAYIERFDGSAAPDTPAFVWAADGEVARVLAWLKGIELMDFASTCNPAQDVPGGSFALALHCFDGSAVNVHFALDTVCTESGYYAYKAEPDGLTVPQLSLCIPSLSYPTDSTEIPITLVNQSGQTGSMVLAPTLERMTEEGWMQLAVNGGFCGTPDPFSTGVTDGWTVPLSLYEDVVPGVYRVTLGARDAKGTEYKISAVFTFED